MKLSRDLVEAIENLDKMFLMLARFPTVLALTLGTCYMRCIFIVPWSRRTSSPSQKIYKASEPCDLRSILYRLNITEFYGKGEDYLQGT